MSQITPTHTNQPIRATLLPGFETKPPIETGQPLQPIHPDDVVAENTNADGTFESENQAEQQAPQTDEVMLLARGITNNNFIFTIIENPAPGFPASDALYELILILEPSAKLQPNITLSAYFQDTDGNALFQHEGIHYLYNTSSETLSVLSETLQSPDSTVLKSEANEEYYHLDHRRRELVKHTQNRRWRHSIQSL